MTVATAAITAALVGCGQSSAGSSDNQAAVNVPTEPFGDKIQYDPSMAVNDGKDITVELWSEEATNRRNCIMRRKVCTIALNVLLIVLGLITVYSFV